jgi:hypothetical protein
LARCEGCGFAWYGPTAADGLRALGCCNRCGGHVVFSADAAAPEDDPIDPQLGPHQVLGNPRIEL